jgi:hypothetical protein
MASECVKLFYDSVLTISEDAAVYHISSFDEEDSDDADDASLDQLWTAIQPAIARIRSGLWKVNQKVG